MQNLENISEPKWKIKYNSQFNNQQLKNDLGDANQPEKTGNKIPWLFIGLGILLIFGALAIQKQEQENQK